MKAVNLLPLEHRRGGGAANRSGSGVYVLLGALAALVIAAGAYVMATNQVNSSRVKLAETEQQASLLEQQAAAFKPYKDFAQLSQARVQTVAELAASRFDWERVMRELARTLPAEVWLTSLVGTVSPGISIEGATSAGTGSLRSAVPAPAVELVGCTESHSEVSRVMARLRTINGVQRVSLASSEKSQTEAVAGAAGGSSSGDCRNGSTRFPQFQIVVFFDAPKSSLGSASGGAPTATGVPVPAGAPASTGDVK